MTLSRFRSLNILLVYSRTRSIERLGACSQKEFCGLPQSCQLIRKDFHLTKYNMRTLNDIERAQIFISDFTARALLGSVLFRTGAVAKILLYIYVWKLALSIVLCTTITKKGADHRYTTYCSQPCSLIAVVLYIFFTFRMNSCNVYSLGVIATLKAMRKCSTTVALALGNFRPTYLIIPKWVLCRDGFNAVQ